jgi:hypothetical protein
MFYLSDEVRNLNLLLIKHIMNFRFIRRMQKLIKIKHLECINSLMQVRVQLINNK